VAETHALGLRYLGRALAHRVLMELLASSTTLVQVSTADERRAQAILTQYTDKAFSYTDATSFAVMERLGISQVFTFGDDFVQYRFTDVAIVLGLQPHP
jgi:predicted nucleic acid-binding protein